MQPVKLVLSACLLLLPRFSSAVCNADNCLRALRGQTSDGAAYAFCSTYTAATPPATSTPAFVSPCSGLASRVTSACSCIATTPTTSTLATPTSTCTKSLPGVVQPLPPGVDPRTSYPNQISDADFERSHDIWSFTPASQGSFDPSHGVISTCSQCTIPYRYCTAFKASPSASNDGTSVTLSTRVCFVPTTDYVFTFHIGLEDPSNANSKYSFEVQADDGTPPRTYGGNLSPCPDGVCSIPGGNGVSYSEITRQDYSSSGIKTAVVTFTFIFPAGVANSPIYLDDFLFGARPTSYPFKMPPSCE